MSNIVIFSANALQTSYINVWLHLVMRLCLAIGVLFIILKPKKQLTMHYRVYTYGFSFFICYVYTFNVI